MKKFHFHTLILGASLLLSSCSEEGNTSTDLGEIHLSFMLDGIRHELGVDSVVAVLEPFTTNKEGYWVMNSLGRGNHAFIDYEFHFSSADNYSGMFEFRNLYDTTLLTVENYETSRDWWEFRDINDFYSSFEVGSYRFLPAPDPHHYPGMILRYKRENEKEYQTFLDQSHLRDTTINYEQGGFSILQAQPYDHPNYGHGMKIMGEFECELFQRVTHDNISLTNGQFTLFFKKP